MKRILLSLTAIFVVMTIAARTQLPRTVQGVPYTPKAADGKLRAASDWEWATPDDMAGRVVGAFVADSDCARVALTLPSGVYVVAATSGSHTLKFTIQ